MTLSQVFAVILVMLSHAACAVDGSDAEVKTEQLPVSDVVPTPNVPVAPSQPVLLPRVERAAFVRSTRSESIDLGPRVMQRMTMQVDAHGRFVHACAAGPQNEVSSK